MRLDEYLEDYAVSLYKFARLVHVSPSTVYNIFNGRNISLEMAYRIEKATDGKVTCQDLAKMIKEPTEEK